ncbi:MAG: polyprenyl synthetase family protein [Acidobacteriota bacterium]|nr:polyprenyl synthetase family protein [Acidobacteriota bacterium]
MTEPATEALRAYLDSCRAEIDAAIDRFLPRAPACPAILGEAMRYSALAGGKRLRPVLALAAADAVSGGRAAMHALTLPAATAIELIHTYSLIHDDLPAMDNDTLRRGRPTLHVAYDEGTAILAGDALLAEAFGLLAREPAAAPGVPPDVLAARKLRVIGLVADAAGAGGMVGGQVIDLQAAAPGAPPMDATALQGMHARKTGALIRAAAGAGAIMGGGRDVDIEAIDRYATELGLAFQIVDDILDVEGDTAALGKTAGKDAAAGKPTYPAIFGLDESHRLARACVARAHEALAGAGLGISRLADIADWVVARTH